MIPPQNQEPFLRIKQVAAHLDTPIRTVRGWANAGLLSYYKPGKAMLFLLSDVTAFMNSCRRRSDADLNKVAAAKYQELNAPSTNPKRS